LVFDFGLANAAGVELEFGRQFAVLFEVRLGCDIVAVFDVEQQLLYVVEHPLLANLTAKLAAAVPRQRLFR